MQNLNPIGGAPSRQPRCSVIKAGLNKQNAAISGTGGVSGVAHLHVAMGRLSILGFATLGASDIH